MTPSLRFCSAASAVLLAGSLLLFGATAYLRLFVPVGALFLVAVPLVLVLAAAFFEQRRILGLRANEDLYLQWRLPKWLWAIAASVPLAVGPAFLSSTAGDSAAQSEERITEQSWYEREGRYFTRINGAVEREISRAEFEAASANVFRFLSLGTVVFSFLSLGTVVFSFLSLVICYQNPRGRAAGESDGG